ncbi:MAG: hypothetical protein KatS3mg105_4671 [Gemmatales bacterium]|nr:MAG: hypothetical protein KatS3mg105_4671 [Gemmatales bacterium]
MSWRNTLYVCPVGAFQIVREVKNFGVARGTNPRSAFPPTVGIKAAAAVISLSLSDNGLSVTRSTPSPTSATSRTSPASGISESAKSPVSIDSCLIAGAACRHAFPEKNSRRHHCQSSVNTRFAFFPPTSTRCRRHAGRGSELPPIPTGPPHSPGCLLRNDKDWCRSVGQAGPGLSICRWRDRNSERGDIGSR